jgi:hypothetical protein
VCSVFLSFRFLFLSQDQCDKGVLSVTVQVLSNELEGRPSEEKMAFIVERNDLPREVHRAEVYLSPTRYSRMRRSIETDMSLISNHFHANIVLGIGCVPLAVRMKRLVVARAPRVVARAPRVVARTRALFAKSKEQRV